ncbi:MAG: phosphoglycerate mutase family protein [Muribaculaceae bacterium]|nr:phosphoglycerate mutase family protein [Muribaculaceae bacterium]
MNQEEINSLALANQAKAHMVFEESGIPQIWKSAGCRVNLIGSLKMGLLVNHNDIDLHVYSKGITEQSTFAIAARMSALPGVIDITSINGLHTDEHCMAWHVRYRAKDGEEWKFDIIHIEGGTQYDGFFENMAERIMVSLTEDQRNTILRLKYETPEDELIHGVEYYEAVIADNIDTLDNLRKWVVEHRKKPLYYWIPNK